MISLTLTRSYIMKYRKLIIVLSIFFAQNLIAEECFYTAKQSSENPYPELSPQGECGKLIDDDRFQIYRNHLDRLLFSSNGLASVFVGKKVFYVSKSGTSARVHYVDNGADCFVEGLTRTMSEGKYGFMDEKLNIVIKPVYDFVFPFEKGLAVVCNGCVENCNKYSGLHWHNAPLNMYPQFIKTIGW